LIREKKVENELTGKKENMEEYVHHVLRCKNEKCRMWWNRDILAYSKIGKQARHCLEFGELLDTFSKASKVVKPKISR